MVRVLLPIPPIPIQQFSLNQYSVFILSYYLSVSDTEHGENHHHNSFPAWLLFSQEVIAVFLKKKFVWLSKYLSLTQPQTLHQLSKYFLKMFHTSSSNFILLETSLLEPCSQLCLVYPIPRDYFTLFRNKSFSHWPGLGRGSLLTIRSGRGDLESDCFSNFPMILFEPDINILGLLMYLPCVHLLSSFQNLCTVIFPFVSHVLKDLCP